MFPPHPLAKQKQLPPPLRSRSNSRLLFVAEAAPSSLRSRSSSRLLFESESCPPLASVPSDSIAWSPIFASPLIFFLPSLSPSPVPQSSATAAPGSQFSHRCDAPEDAQDDSQNDSPEAAPANPL